MSKTIFESLKDSQKRLDAATSLASTLTGYLEGLLSGGSLLDRKLTLQTLIKFHTRNPISSSSEWIKGWEEQIKSIQSIQSTTDVK